MDAVGSAGASEAASTPSAQPAVRNATISGATIRTAGRLVTTPRSRSPEQGWHGPIDLHAERPISSESGVAYSKRLAVRVSWTMSPSHRRAVPGALRVYAATSIGSTSAGRSHSRTA